MSAADRLDDSFPHGTPAGYEQGCRSSGGCRAKHETGQSCAEARIRASRDASYRALVQSGAPVSVLAQPEVADARPVAPVTRPTPHQAIPKMLRDKPAAPKPAATGPKHGTISGYARGCRADCPGDENGYTCRQASAEYSRAYKAKKAAERREHAGRHAPAPTTKETPSAPVSPATVAPAPPQTSASPPEAASPSSPTAAPAAPAAASPSTAHPADQNQPTAPPAPSAPTASSTTASSTPQQSGSPTLLADLAITFHTLHEETRRSPEVVTPFDGLPGLMSELLRASWLDGHRAGVNR